MIAKDMFKIFQETNDKYDLYLKVIKYIEGTIDKTKGEENAIFYDTVVKLLNSINNAGWEDRHSEQIQILWDAQNDIISKYEDYLP